MVIQGKNSQSVNESYIRKQFTDLLWSFVTRTCCQSNAIIMIAWTSLMRRSGKVWRIDLGNFRSADRVFPAKQGKCFRSKRWSKIHYFRAKDSSWLDSVSSCVFSHMVILKCKIHIHRFSTELSVKAVLLQKGITVVLHIILWKIAISLSHQLLKLAYL